MNKKVNTLLFILGATVFNILVAILSFILLSWVYARFIFRLIPEGANLSWVFSLIFLSSIGISFLVYRAVLKYLLAKIEIEKYFDPLFVRKHNRKN